ncbi:MAG: TonB-dependent receptor [Proteobacteria bacterium]|nr:TonB-dependent receptor [Pseudomonadota bacterium]
MLSNSRLQTAVRLCLGIGAGALAVGYAPGAAAQDADGADETLEEIITTGTRIKRADLDSASPITVLTRQDIIAAGITDVGSLIQKMPSMAGTPLGTTVNNGNTNTGTVQIDLRGMGPSRTVTLVNGRRTVDGGDYTTIPSTMIERVEILKDGASAIYGADAVSGVVNIITRTDFEGVELEAQQSAWFDTNSGEQTTISMIAGKNFGDGHFVAGIEFVDQQEIFQRDTPWGYMQSSYYIFEPGCEALGGTTTECDFFGSSRIPESRISFTTPGGLETTTPDDPDDGSLTSAIFMIESPGAVMTPYDSRTYNYAPVNYMQTPYDRLNVFAEGSFEVSDNVTFRATIRTSDRTSDAELAPLPYDTNIYPSYAGTFNGAAYLGVSEDNYYVQQGIDAYNAANGTAFGYEPVTNVRRRMVEIPRHYEVDMAQWQTVMSFEGIVNDMDWEVYYNRGKRTISTYQTGQFSGVRLTGALGPSADLDGDGNPECYTDITDASTLIVGCVPMNFWAGEGAVTQDMLDYVAVTRNDTRQTEQEIAGASITGSAFELPGGELGWAAGFGYWGQKFVFTPDSAAAIGAITGGTGTGTDGTLYSKAVFAEVYAPVFDNGTQSLSLKAGLRYDDYNTFGGDATWQFGAEFAATETFKLRATAGTAFRAPSISELFGGLGRSAPTYADPCDPADFQDSWTGDGTSIAPGCARSAFRTDTQVTSFVGGNENLTPETADTVTAGFVFTPQIGDGSLSLTVDYWKIEMEDAINALGVRYILDQCYVQQNAVECAKIERRDDIDFTIRQILDSQVNVAANTGEGVDTEIRYSFGTNVGEFELALLWSHMLERSRVPKPGDPVDDQLGKHVDFTTCDTCGTFAEDKMNFSARYNRGDLTVSYLAEFIGSINADAQYIDYNYKIDSQLYHDIVLDYSFDNMGTTRVTLGVTNLTNEPPPFIDQGFNASTDPITYRVFGRGWFLRLSQTF